MMILAAALIGLLAGTLIDGAAVFLPRFSASRPPDLPARPSIIPAAWQVFAARRDWRGWLRQPDHALSLGVEFASALVFAYLWNKHGLSWTFCLLAVSWLFFALIAVIDLKYRLVLNVVTYPAIALLLIGQLLVAQKNAAAILLGGLFAFGMFYLPTIIRPGSIGSGDIKLALLIGVAFGFPLVFWPLMVGIGAGGVVAILLLARKHRLNSGIPYAPFLCFGAMIALLENPLVGRVLF